MEAAKKREYITFINVISCIAVVFLHTNEIFWTFHKERYWITSNFIECLFYFAVPCFFMVSGATLIDYQDRYSTRDYFVKRIEKTVFPFLFWSIFGLFFGMFVTGTVKLQDLNFKYFYNGIMNAKFNNVYWYFPPLFCVYLSIPLFGAVDKNKRFFIFNYLAFAGIVFNIIFPFIKNLFLQDYSFPITVPVIANYCIYAVIGYLLSEYEIKRNARLKIMFLGLCGFFLQLIGTHILSFKINEISKLFKGYTNVPSLLYSISIFVWAKYYGSKILNNKYIYKCVKILSEYTFSIYLIHWYIMKLIILSFNFNIKSIYYRLGAPFIIIPICILIIKTARKISILKYVFK